MTRQIRLYDLCDIPTPYQLGVQRHIAARWPGHYRIAYCASAEPGRSWSFDFSGLDVEMLRGIQYRPRRQVNPISIKWNPGVWSSLSAFRPDVVVLSGYFHPTMYLAALWCRLHGVPFGMTCETAERNTTTAGWKWRIKRVVAGWLVRRLAFALPVGREAADYLRLFGRDDLPMFPFPNTPDTSAIVAQAEIARRGDNARKLRDEFCIPPDAGIILFVGRLIDAKRPLDLVSAFQSLGARAPNAVVVFVGDGPLLANVKAAAAGDPRIICTGWISDPAKTAGLMAISSLFVLPSQHETWGAVVNEAMAAGLPVIASDSVGAAVELIEDERQGFVYRTGDVGALSRAMERLLSDDALRIRMGVAAHETAKRFGHMFATQNFIDGALAAAGVAADSAISVDI